MAPGKGTMLKPGTFEAQVAILAYERYGLDSIASMAPAIDKLIQTLIAAEKTAMDETDEKMNALQAKARAKAERDADRIAKYPKTKTAKVLADQTYSPVDTFRDLMREMRVSHDTLNVLMERFYPE